MHMAVAMIEAKRKFKRFMVRSLLLVQHLIGGIGTSGNRITKCSFMHLVTLGMAAVVKA